MRRPKSHCCIWEGVSKAKAIWRRQEVFLRQHVFGGYDPCFCQLLTFPLATEGSWSQWKALCSNSCLPAFQVMRQATGEAAKIISQMLLQFHVSITPLPLLKHCQGASVKLTSVSLHFWLRGLQIPLVSFAILIAQHISLHCTAFNLITALDLLNTCWQVQNLLWQ